MGGWERGGRGLRGWYGVRIGEGGGGSQRSGRGLGEGW